MGKADSSRDGSAMYGAPGSSLLGPMGGIGPGVNACEFREVSVSFQIGLYVWGGGHS